MNVEDLEDIQRYIVSLLKAYDIVYDALKAGEATPKQVTEWLSITKGNLQYLNSKLQDLIDTAAL